MGCIFVNVCSVWMVFVILFVVWGSGLFCLCVSSVVNFVVCVLIVLVSVDISVVCLLIGCVVYVGNVVLVVVIV